MDNMELGYMLYMEAGDAEFDPESIDSDLLDLNPFYGGSGASGGSERGSEGD